MNFPAEILISRSMLEETVLAATLTGHGCLLLGIARPKAEWPKADVVLFRSQDRIFVRLRNPVDAVSYAWEKGYIESAKGWENAKVLTLSLGD